jgi:hypothetical protein
MRRCRLLGAFVALLALFLPLATALPAGAGDPVAEARARLEQARAEASAAHAEIENAEAERDQLEADIVALQDEMTALEANIVALDAERERQRQLVARQAAALYQNADSGGSLDFLNDDIEDAARRTELTQAVFESSIRRADALDDMAQQLQQAREELAAKQAELDTRRGELEAKLAELASRQAEFEAKVDAANEAFEKAKAIDALRQLGTPVQGESVLTAADIAGWYRTTGSTPHLTVSIDELAQLYIEEGAAENVRGDLAFAQAYLETGGFNFPSYGQVSSDDNNFAGMGACDSCSTGDQFPTARDGVRAQIQHLLNYADSSSRAANLHNPPSPYWYGSDPGTAARNFDTFFAKGWAPVWDDFGGGNWATDPGYAPKVLGLYERMVGYATGG